MIDAREYAILLHGEQQYGEEPYVVHLDAVVAVLHEFGYDDPDYIDSGYLHDTLEDCEARYRDIEDRYGSTVALIVRACSGFGHNRKARVAMILSNMISYPHAAPVKAADRIANMRAARGTSLSDMYRRELAAFLEAVKGKITPEMFSALEALGK